MKVDDSFAAYVVARWSMLYRLAALLVGVDRADEVAQAALVRAYLTWPELEEHTATDDLVKGLLAVEAAAGPAGTAIDGPTVWAEVTRLPPRQRTVLVLRHHEMLTDDEIARALRCPAETVSAEGLVLDTEPDVTELRDELARHAQAVDVPLPPVEAVIARGHVERRRRTRRGLLWAAGAAAVLVVGLVLGNLVQAATSEHPSASRPTIAVPRSLSVLPTGEPPRIAYSVRRLLHVRGGRVVVMPERPLTIVQTSHWLFLAYRSGGIVRIDPETTVATTVQADSGGQVVTDPSGDQIAWLGGGAGSPVVAVQSVDTTGLVSDRQRFTDESQCCDGPFLVDGITSDGTVIASLPAEGRAWAWHTPDGGERRMGEISGLGNGVVTQVTAAGIAVQYGSSHFALGALQGEAFFVRDEINARSADFGDPNGHRVVYADPEGGIHVRARPFSPTTLRDGQDVRLRLPTLAEGFAAARWEDDRHVLLDVSDASMPAGALVRCDVGNGRCEVAAALEGPHLLAQ
jgi:hypothetical protein